MATGQINSNATEAWAGKVSPFSASYGKLAMWFFLLSDALTFGGFLASLGFARHYYNGDWPIGEEVFHSFPFLSGHFPLMYVAFMTFVLIISSVTMVLAVEAGHRKDQKNVVKWLFATVLGGALFLGSQAWEWSHFIHGSEFGKVLLQDGSWAVSQSEGHGTDAKLTALKVVEAPTQGGTYKLGEVITGQQAENLYAERLSASADNIVKGADLQGNEYGPQAYSNYFFFITGFHGLHVLSGVILNIIILLNAIAGVYQKRGHYEMVEKVGLYWHFVDLVWVFVFTFFYLI